MTDKDKEEIRQIVAEELEKAFSKFVIVIPPANEHIAGDVSNDRFWYPRATPGKCEG